MNDTTDDAIRPDAQLAIRGLLERWARYRIGHASDGIGWPPLSMTGKLMAGMPGTFCPNCGGTGALSRPHDRNPHQTTRCPTCRGDGRINAELAATERSWTVSCEHCADDDGHGNKVARGELHGKTCPHCRGSGQRTFVARQINPAGIRSTRMGGSGEDPRLIKIDRIIAQWGRDDHCRSLYFVTLYEYTRLGRQSDKAQRLGISQSRFSQLLSKAHIRLCRVLGDCA